MEQQEFESRLGRPLKDNENFNTIHNIYLASSLDKNAFTEEWKKKDHGRILEDVAKNYTSLVEHCDNVKRDLENVKEERLQEIKNEGYLWAEEAHETSSVRARSRAIEILGLKGYITYVISNGWNLWKLDRDTLIEIISK